jgi:hypothetical protein
MITLPGTVTLALLLLSTIVAAELAVPVSETEQEAELFAPRLVGEHEMVLRSAGATRLTVLVKEAPPPLAVITALWLTLTCAAVAVKLAVVCPAPTSTLFGTVKFALLLFSVTVNPAPEADWLIVTVQDRLPSVFNVELAQFKPVSCVAAVKLSVAVWLTPA